MSSRILFSTPNDDEKVRFLSNSSKYRIILKGKTWPTVEHYVQAQKFEGTEFEERIRDAKTIFEVRKLATHSVDIWETDATSQKRRKVKGYGRDGQYRMRRDWKRVEKEILEEAIRAKFAQKKILQKKLLDTGSKSLVDVSNPLTGKILEKLRWEISVKDLNVNTLQDIYRDMIRAILHVSYKVMKMEGWDKILPEMVEDAIFLLFSREIARSIIRSYSDYNAKYQKGGLNKMSNFFRMMKEVEKYIKDHKFPFQIQDRPLILMTSVLGWYMWTDDENTCLEVDNSLKNYKTLKIVLRPGRRWYREKVPPKLVQLAE